jgi:hypothetical protein
MTFFKTEAAFELKDLIHGSNGLQSAWFLDRFFLILIYTEVGAETQSFQGCLSESGRDQEDSLFSLT